MKEDDILDLHYSMEDFSDAAAASSSSFRQSSSSLTLSSTKKSDERKRNFESFLLHLMEPEEHDYDDDDDNNNNDYSDDGDDDDDEEEEHEWNDNRTERSFVDFSSKNMTTTTRRSKSFSLKKGKIIRKPAVLLKKICHQLCACSSQQEEKDVEKYSSTRTGSSRVPSSIAVVMTDFPGLEKPIEEYAKSLSRRQQQQQQRRNNNKRMSWSYSLTA